MEVPRVRFTVRRLMVAVAVVGSMIAFIELRKREFTALADDHYAKQVVEVACSKGGSIYEKRSGGMATEIERNADVWHRLLESKYRYAAAHPWLPVAPDPPVPE